MASVMVSVHLKDSDEIKIGKTGDGISYIFADNYGIGIYFEGRTLEMLIPKLKELIKSED